MGVGDRHNWVKCNDEFSHVKIFLEEAGFEPAFPRSELRARHLNHWTIHSTLTQWLKLSVSTCAARQHYIHKLALSVYHYLLGTLCLPLELRPIFLNATYRRAIKQKSQLSWFFHYTGKLPDSAAISDDGNGSAHVWTIRWLLAIGETVVHGIRTT